MNRLNRLLMPLLLVVFVALYQQSDASVRHASFSFVAGLAKASSMQTSYVVVAFEVFGTRYYHFREFDTSNLSAPDAQMNLKSLIRYDRQVLRNRNVSNDDIYILQTWGCSSGAEAANLACNLEQQGLQVWANSACFSRPAQPPVPAPSTPVRPSAPVQPYEPDQPLTPPTYPTQPSTLAGRITRIPQSPKVNETVRFQAEASDSSNPNAALSFNWYIDGQLVVQPNGYDVYDSPTLDWSFDTSGSHSVGVTVTNRYTGASTQMKENVGITQTGGQVGEDRRSMPEPISTQSPVSPVVIVIIGGIAFLVGVSVLLAVLKSLFFRAAR